MLCIAIKGPTYAQAKEQISKALPFADLVELRLDCFQTIDLLALGSLRSQFSIPMIFTLRSKSQGGSYDLPEKKRLATIRELLSLEPEYIDLEYGVLSDFIEETKLNFPSVKLIFSYHNFSETPKDLDGLYHEMRKISAFYYKIALFSQNCLDTLRFLVWARNCESKVIAISMGQEGEFSRILGKVIGSPITYAALNDDLKSAPGQLTAETLIERYNFLKLKESTSIYGLIGYPVSQSIGDVTHNYLFKESRLDAVYVKIAVRREELSECLSLAKRLPFKGMSVTSPLKEEVLNLIDCGDAPAFAVNTLLFEKDKVSGFNTDGLGALNAIEESIEVLDKHIVILGAGGAARAIAYEAHKRGARISILNRSPEKAIEIAQHIGCKGFGLDHMEECAASNYDVLINCTTASMPIKPEYFLPKAYVMDIVTKPKESEFLKHAKLRECRVIFGYQMFVEQAILQFDLWFQGKIDREMWERILKRKAIAILG